MVKPFYQTLDFLLGLGLGLTIAMFSSSVPALVIILAVFLGGTVGLVTAALLAINREDK